ncbi:MAG: helix-turn-helix domain-containing protein [Planctomycetales bacterium]
MKQLVTPKQVARAIGVSESSLKRWCDQGLISSVRTAGGHRRLPISSVLAYLRSTRTAVVAPELLGLPATCAPSDRAIGKGRERLRDALLEGNEAVCRQVVFDQWLSGQPMTEICDHLIAAAFRDIGERWACHQVDVFHERRACEIMLRILLEFRSGLSPGDPSRLAIGGTVEGDQYILPTTMVEVVLRDCGWDARSLGASLPMSSLATAIRECRPRLFWLSVSFVADPVAFITQFPLLNAAADEVGAAIVVGGFAMQGVIRQQIRYSGFCDTMQHLEQFAKSISR